VSSFINAKAGSFQLQRSPKTQETKHLLKPLLRFLCAHCLSEQPIIMTLTEGAFTAKLYGWAHTRRFIVLR
jgi:hypothetical protein